MTSRIVAFLLPAAALVGCSNGGSVPSGGGAAMSAPSSITASPWFAPQGKRKKAKTLIYWANEQTSQIYIFSSRGVGEGEFTTPYAYPVNLFVDKQLDLFVSFVFGNIVAYKPGETTPSFLITDGTDHPIGLTIDAAGTVYCGNAGNDTITEYPKGKTSPTRTLDLTTSPLFLATDAHDNLYASATSDVVEFAKGSTKGKNLGLSVVSPAGLEVDRSGNIIVVDSNDNDIDIFAPGETNPSKQISVTRGAPWALSLSSDEKQLYVSVYSGGDYFVQVLSYPNGTSLSKKLTTDEGTYPIAVSPDNVLGS